VGNPDRYSERYPGEERRGGGKTGDGDQNRTEPQGAAGTCVACGQGWRQLFVILILILICVEIFT